MIDRCHLVDRCIVAEPLHSCRAGQLKQLRKMGASRTPSRSGFYRVETRNNLCHIQLAHSSHTHWHKTWFRCDLLVDPLAICPFHRWSEMSKSVCVWNNGRFSWTRMHYGHRDTRCIRHFLEMDFQINLHERAKRIKKKNVANDAYHVCSNWLPWMPIVGSWLFLCC